MMKCDECTLEYDSSDPFVLAEHVHEVVFIPQDSSKTLAFWCQGHEWKKIHRVVRIVCDRMFQHIRFVYECGYVETHNKGPFNTLFADSYEVPASDGKLHYQVILRDREK